jgi:hypothetical protein
MITLNAPDESFCALFGLAKIGETPIQFKVPEFRAETRTEHYVFQVIL